MATTGQTNRRKSDRRKRHPREDGVQIIGIGREGEKRHEVTVRHEIPSQRKEKSTVSWFESFALEWSEILIPKKKKK
jgi:hypothetical protein